jgi:hypothetical protein
VSEYTLEPSGRVNFGSGGFAFRVAGPGVIMLWDKRTRQERPLTVKDLAELFSEFGKENHEPEDR